MIDVLGAIPARMGSSRFPGKPLVLIDGKPMLWHVWQRTKLSDQLDDIVIATCDREIKEAAESFGAKVIMTSDKHVRANDRIAEVAERMPCNIILNIQGDEPAFNPQLITDAVKMIKSDSAIQCVSPASIIADDEELNNIHTIKVAFDLKGKIIYFSRCPIPSDSVVKREFPSYRQVPIIAFRSNFCQKIAKLEPGPFELQEGTDLLRAIEHDLPVHVLITQFSTIGVDIPSDRDMVENILKNDPIYKLYKNNSMEAVSK